ncbi:MAG: 30S ribosomal protein S1, partial [Planctomycetota bacterium]|nr:30S ribosomal protein S1 [Planctomycetota bacterium]
IEVYLEAVEDESGLLVLSKRKADRIRGWERIIQSHKVGDVVKGKAVRKIKGGLLVDIGVHAFLPASQVDIKRIGDVGEFIGREIECKIIKIDEDRRNIVLSRRKLMEEERDRMKKDLLATIQRGEVRRGVVKNVTEFGAFVDLGGIDGLLHITDMSWGRIQHPSELVKPEQTIEVKVLDFDIARERISLGLKQLTPNPWTQVESKYPVGSKHKGTVVTIMPYGAFIRLEPGVEGLVHISEMSWTKSIGHPSEILQAGQEVDVVVLEINTDKQEISLGMKQMEDNPWLRVEEKYPPGTRIKGKVRNMTTYGAFVEIEEGIDGLLHVSDMSWTRKITHPSAVLKKGETVEAVVLSVDKERKRVALGLKQLAEDPWERDIPRRFKPGQHVRGKITKLTSFGAFVEIEKDLEGLLHISEMSENKIEKPEEVVKLNQEIDVKIINVDPKDRKIGLSIKAYLKDKEKGIVGPAPEEKVDISAYSGEKDARPTLGDKLAEAFKEKAAEISATGEKEEGGGGEETGAKDKNAAGIGEAPSTAN